MLVVPPLGGIRTTQAIGLKAGRPTRPSLPSTSPVRRGDYARNSASHPAKLCYPFWSVSESDPVLPPTPDVPPRNLWQRRVVDPIVAQLTQGLTPQKIALTIAIGSSIAMFPILGTTTLICLIVGVFMKLNQPIIQAVNWACTPIHIPFIFYSFKWGELAFGSAHTRLEMRVMRRLLVDDPLRFVQDYSTTALHAVVIWAILVPFWAAAVYYISLPIMRSIESARLAAAAKAATEKARTHPIP